MSSHGGEVGPVQLVLIGFGATSRLRGEVAAELADMRGRGLIRILDARLFNRSAAGELTVVDLGPLLANPPEPGSNPLAQLLGIEEAGGIGTHGNGAPALHQLADTVGFAVEDIRRLIDEIQPTEHGLALLVEHVWAAHFREAALHAGGRLVGQGFLTRDVTLIVGAELQARRDALTALDLAEAARCAALLSALDTFAARGHSSAEARTQAATGVVRVLVQEGFVHEPEAGKAVEALTAAGLIEAAMLEAAEAEAERLLADDEQGPLPR